MTESYDVLKLENQLCFPLYAASRQIVKLYTPYLRELDLTYTQYIVLMVLWEEGRQSVKALGSRLFLDSGTLTPVLKSLEKKGYVSRTRSREDERFLQVSVTEAGMELREAACAIPGKIGGCLDLDEREAGTLYRLLYRILASAGTDRPEEVA